MYDFPPSTPLQGQPRWKPVHDPRLSPFQPRRTQKRRKRVTVVGVFGELLITAGLFLLLFVVWQLWWTSVKVESAVAGEVAAFRAENPPAQDTASPYTDMQRTDAPPEVGDIPEGEIYALLHVPRWNYRVMPIAQGTSHYVLDYGWAGHYMETQQAGEIGNFAIAAHRRTYGNNFRRIDTLEDGDPIVVETDQAWLVYQVTGREIVNPSDTRVILPVPNEPGETPTKRVMTMTTCHPEFGNTERFIVWSEMVYWVPKSEGIPILLKDEPAGGGSDGT